MTKNERLQCRTVCWRWFNLLVTASTTFKSDWFLNLSNQDVQKSSFDFILSSQIRYQSLTLNVNVVIDKGTEESWQKLGKTVTCVALTDKVVTGIDENLMKMMSFFTNARTLVIDDSVEILKEIGTTEEDVFQNIDTLFLNSLSVQDVTVLTKGIQRLTKLSSLHLGKSIDHLTLLIVLELKSQFNHLQIKSGYINFDDWNCVHEFYLTPDKTQVMIDLLNILNGTLTKLTFANRTNDIESLRKIHCNNPDMKEVELVWTGLPIEPIRIGKDPVMKSIIDPSLITSFDLWLDFSSNESPTFAPLDQFNNLTELKVTVKNSKEEKSEGCFFGHKMLNFRKLRKLSYTYYHSKVCHLCLKTMIRSCMRLETLEIDLGENISPLTLCSWSPSLKKLKIRKVSNLQAFDDQDLILTLPNLESIELEGECHCNDKLQLLDATLMIHGLFRMMRGVKDIVLKGFLIHQDKQQFEQILFKELPGLRKLDIDLCSFQEKLS